MVYLYLKIFGWAKMMADGHRWGEMGKMLEGGTGWQKMVADVYRWAKMVEDGPRWGKMVED